MSVPSTLGGSGDSPGSFVDEGVSADKIFQVPFGVSLDAHLHASPPNASDSNSNPPAEEKGASSSLDPNAAAFLPPVLEEPAELPSLEAIFRTRVPQLQAVPALLAKCFQATVRPAFS